jgi:hypothetical protein
MVRTMPTIHSSIFDWQLSCTQSASACCSTCVRLLHALMLNKQSHANHSVQLWSLFVGCTVIIYTICCASVVLQQCAAACALLNERSHANHSFQPYIFDCSCFRLSCTAISLTAVLQQCAADDALLKQTGTMPTIHSSCIFDCNVRLYVHNLPCAYYSSALLHVRAQQTEPCQPFQSSCTSLFVAVRLSCSQSAACCVLRQWLTVLLCVH